MTTVPSRHHLSVERDKMSSCRAHCTSSERQKDVRPGLTGPPTVPGALEELRFLATVICSIRVSMGSCSDTLLAVTPPANLSPWAPPPPGVCYARGGGPDPPQEVQNGLRLAGGLGVRPSNVSPVLWLTQQSPRRAHHTISHLSITTQTCRIHSPKCVGVLLTAQHPLSRTKPLPQPTSHLLKPTHPPEPHASTQSRQV